MSDANRNEAKAIIFDADGTLFNSFELIVAAYEHVALAHHLRPPTSIEIRSKLGKPLPEIFKAFYPDRDTDELLLTNNTFVAANVMKSEAYEGLEDMLETLKEQGYALAVLTNAGSKMLDIIKHHALDQYFASVVHHERIANFKPNPEGFYLAAEECGVRPQEAIMVGDTDIDIATGKNANAFATVAVTHGFGQPEDLAKAAPDYTVNSLSEFSQLAISLKQ